MTTATAPARLRAGDTTWSYDPYFDAYRPDSDDPDLRGVLRTWEQLHDIYDGQVTDEPR